jgi:hypothetical protein
MPVAAEVEPVISLRRGGSAVSGFVDELAGGGAADQDPAKRAWLRLARRLKLDFHAELVSSRRDPDACRIPGPWKGDAALDPPAV